MAERNVNRLKFLLKNMGLNEYQASALAYLILLGEVKASSLSKASGVPTARIYDTLEDLSKMGLIKIRPGRPILYSPRNPTEIINLIIGRTMEELRNKVKIIESYSKEFTKLAEEVFLKGKEKVERPPLLRIVRVGEVSLEETRRLYSQAKGNILILTRAMEYFPEVEEELTKAVERGVKIKIIMLDPELMEVEDRKKQEEIIKQIKNKLPKAEIRYTKEVPIRGCIIDPAEGGQTLFLVEEPGVPLFLREAAITNHSSLVKGLAIMFDLIWKHRTTNPT